jgi:hypothetical protein
MKTGLVSLKAAVNIALGPLFGLSKCVHAVLLSLLVAKVVRCIFVWMLAGLVSLKVAVNIALGPLFGLSK